MIEQAGFKVGKSDGGLVTEAKPPVKWDKGNAAIYILKTAFGIHWSDNIRVIFAGDDLTDEDAMKALKVYNADESYFLNHINDTLIDDTNYALHFHNMIIGNGIFLPCNQLRNGTNRSRSSFARYKRCLNHVKMG